MWQLSNSDAVLSGYHPKGTVGQGDGFGTRESEISRLGPRGQGSDETTPVPTILGEGKALHFSPAKEIRLNFTSPSSNDGENSSIHNRLYLQGYSLFFHREYEFVFRDAPSTILQKTKTLSRIFESGRAFFIIPNKQGVLRVSSPPASGHDSDFLPPPEGQNRHIFPPDSPFSPNDSDRVRISKSHITPLSSILSIIPLHWEFAWGLHSVPSEKPFPPEFSKSKVRIVLQNLKNTGKNARRREKLLNKISSLGKSRLSGFPF